MAAGKSVIVFAMGANVEASYGSGATVTFPGDAIELTEASVAEIGYTYDGARGFNPASGTSQKRATPLGRFATFPQNVTFRGAGAAYAAGVFPPETHRLMQACGFDLVLDATPGSESWTATPLEPTDPFVSTAYELYSRGQLWTIDGVLGSLGFTIEGASGMIWTGALSGLLAGGKNPVEAAFPAGLKAEYAGRVIPPKAAGLSLVLGNYTAGIVKRVEFTQNRTIEPSTDLNASDAFGGFSAGTSEPTLTVDIEADSFHPTSPFHAAAAIDPYEIFREAGEFAVSFTVGSVQYNRMSFSATAQLAGPPGEQAEGANAVWSLTLQLNDYSILFN